MGSLINITELSDDSLQLALNLSELGLLPILENETSSFTSSSQFFRLKSLVQQADNTQLQADLFPMHSETGLGVHTTLYKIREESEFVKGLEVLIQLLPIHLETISDTLEIETTKTINLKGSPFEIKTNNIAISEFLSGSLNDFFNVLNQRSLVLARSANYQGSKAVFTPAICSIVRAFSTKNTVVVDLMCGAGSVSGSLADFRPVIASDAQSFSRNLAKVQGGGMDVISAKDILSKVLPSFIKYFDLLEDEVLFDLEKESEFLSTEISEPLCIDFTNWVSNYARVGNENSNQASLKKKIELRKEDNFIKPGILFTRYYANLFYGVHQAAEIDALRMAISDLDNPLHQQWALGALTATISYCAYSYAGHFAQPKMNLSKTGDTSKQVKAILKKRSISVQHEFSARLLSLAEEREKTPYDIQDVEGPWEEALLKIDQMVSDKDVLVYLDPPYTRDEFSRYYHVLETLNHYNYPEISGKASVPLKGGRGRFRSKFFSRNTTNIESLLVEIISECLERGWSCLWSYSSSGLANISKVLQQLENQTSCIEIFSADHAYSGQGKQKAKQVIEYFILLKP